MFTGVAIDGYDPMPPFGSGVLMVLRVAHGTTAQGEKRVFYFIHGGGDLFLTRGAHAYPTLGARCDISATGERRTRSATWSQTSTADAAWRPSKMANSDPRCPTPSRCWQSLRRTERGFSSALSSRIVSGTSKFYFCSALAQDVRVADVAAPLHILLQNKWRKSANVAPLRIEAGVRFAFAAGLKGGPTDERRRL
jgi:hypothetical protein